MRHRTAIAPLALAAALVGGALAQDRALDAKTFEIAASKFAFTPNRIEVELGDRVTLKLYSTDVEHGLAIKPYRIKLVIPKGGAVVTTEFVADKAGAFPFSCSEYCGGGHSRMKGMLLVHPKGELP